MCMLEQHACQLACLIPACLLPGPLQVYMILEMAPGGDLMDMVMKRQRYGELEARRFFKRLLEGLEYCHDRWGRLMTPCVQGAVQCA